MRTRGREDYLKTIYTLQRTSSPVRTTDIARALGVEPASVTGVIKRLAELDLLEYAPYKGVTLTDKGLKVALEVIRSHRLIELYLVEALGYTWDEVHEEAERLEHAVSPRFIARIEAALGYPETDPHGAPIPTEDGTIRPRSENPLSSLKVSESGTITRVTDEDPGLLRYLDSLGIRPGEQVTVLSVAPYGGPIQLLVGEAEHNIGREAAMQIFVRASTGD
ncbi:MAG: metal-dependent transcriptional regulator [Anaerolineae bacterium]